jgi:hypothetical protein
MSIDKIAKLCKTNPKPFVDILVNTCINLFSDIPKVLIVSSTFNLITNNNNYFWYCLCKKFFPMRSTSIRPYRLHVDYKMTVKMFKSFPYSMHI